MLKYINVYSLLVFRTANKPCHSTFRVCLVEQLFPRDLGFFRQGLQVVPRLQVNDAVQIFLRWRAKNACKKHKETQDGCSLTSLISNVEIREKYVSPSMWLSWSK